jgi:hypothetical protein
MIENAKLPLYRTLKDISGARKKNRILQYLKEMCSLLKDVLFLITNGLDELLHPLQVDLANGQSGTFQSKRERERCTQDMNKCFQQRIQNSNNKTKKNWHNNASTLNPKSNFFAAVQKYI